MIWRRRGVIARPDPDGLIFSPDLRHPATPDQYERVGVNGKVARALVVDANEPGLLERVAEKVRHVR